MNAPAHHDNQHLDRTISTIAGMQSELSAEGLFSLGYWFQGLNQLDHATRCYHNAIAQAPHLWAAHYNLGVIDYQKSQLSDAVNHFKKALSINPGLAEVLSSIGVIYCEQHRYSEALVCLEQAIETDPNLASAHFHLGVALQHDGQYQNGLDAFRKALVCDPLLASARWLLMLSLPKLYENEKQITALRRQFAVNMDQLIQPNPLNTPQQKHYALMGIHTGTNFYLQYQGQNDVDLQIKYGRFVHRVMVANFPQWAETHEPPSRPTGSKIRIGYVSSFMYSHTVGIFLAGWLNNHNRSAFEIHCYHMGNAHDALTHHLKEHCDAFHCFYGNVEEAARQISSDQLHILVHTDIGMHTETMQLAALRLAPVQCKGWGHPVTTGLPTMDYYLSSELMEPPDGDQFYSEKLIRLPKLALCYQQPSLPQHPSTRRQLGLPQGRFIYLSTQSLFKYLPQHDDIYPQIARQVPEAHFVFVANQSDRVTEQFRQRLMKAFKLYGIDPEGYLCLIPRLNGNDFLSLNMAADVLLDTFDWSGGRTTLEAISCGLPVVTCPGRFMRGRHAYAMLTMMGVTETIGTDKSTYCQIAVNMATDPHFRSKVTKKILENRHKLYGDKTFMYGLEQFFKSIVYETTNE